MPRATAAAAAATAVAVLDTATAHFVERGYAEASLDEIARAAGVTRGAVYHHYDSKVGLLLAVVARQQAAVAHAVTTAADAAGGGPDEQLRAGCHAFLETITAGPAARLLLVDAPAALGWARWRALDQEASGVHLRDALAASGVREDLVDALAAQLSGAMNEAALWLVEREGDEEARRSARAALDRLLAAAVT